MEEKVPGRRMGKRNYSREFREMVVAQASDPQRTVAEVALEHGLNANMVSRWRRDHRRASVLETRTDEFVGVRFARGARQPSIVVAEHGRVRVRFEGALDARSLQTVLAALRAAA